MLADGWTTYLCYIMAMGKTDFLIFSEMHFVSVAIVRQRRNDTTIISHGYI